MKREADRFPFLCIEPVPMNETEKLLLQHLSNYLTPNRSQLFDQVLNMRTRYLTVVLEDTDKAQNASAVLRTCDCFGIQDIHAIENNVNFSVNRDIAMGSSKWLTLRRYNENANNTLEVIQALKAQNYRIVATSPHIHDQELENFDLSKGKVALFFGSEKPGISEIVRKEADEFIKIPMHGFTESFNISVSAAIILHHLTVKMRQDPTIDWKLSNEEKASLKLHWIRKSLKRSELIEKRFLKELQNK